jgi:UDP-GlcNAc:undecaprenyl-phosphate/decaprenyl-phosphate GlcNAc-1-phosphate transferase
MDFVLGFFLALFVSILAMPFLMRYAGRFHLIDAPDVRKAHAGLVPRAGGIGIALSAFIPVLLWANHQMPLAGFLAGGLIIVLFGILDDRYNLDYRLKLLGQGAAALLLVASGTPFTQLPLFGMDAVPPSSPIRRPSSSSWRRPMPSTSWTGSTAWRAAARSSAWRRSRCWRRPPMAAATSC